MVLVYELSSILHLVVLLRKGKERFDIVHIFEYRLLKVLLSRFLGLVYWMRL
jgi:hypothetical protein